MNDRFRRLCWCMPLLLAGQTVWAVDGDVSMEAISPVRTLPVELSLATNWWQTQVGARTAYTLGARGKGIVVAVVDTGIDLKNTQFTGRLLTGYNALPLGAFRGAQDDNGHGTHVAGIIGAAADGVGPVGIAPDVTLLPIKVLDSRGSGTQSSFTAGIQYSIGKAQILNMSLGASSAFGQAGIQSAVNAGQLVVAAAGNDGTLNPGWPARYAKETWAKGQVIAAGAVDSRNVMASWSNRAGDTRNFYVVAPGVSITSTRLGGGTVTMSGTSMATPMVSGVAADIWSYWSYLTASQVASIIFRTATHLGTSAVGTPDAVYGWGLVNLQQALQPVGLTSLSTPGAGTASVTGSGLTTNSLIRSASFEGVTLTARDEFGRAFGVPMTALARRPAAAEVNTLFAAMDRQLSLVERTSGRTLLAMSAVGAPDELQLIGNPFLRADLARSGQDRAQLTGMNLIQSYDCQGGRCRKEFAMGANGFADRYFGLSAEPGTIPVAAGFANPYFQFAANASHVAMGWGWDEGTKLKVGLLGTVRPVVSPMSLGADQQSNGWIGELERRYGDGVLKLSVGQIREDGALLGMTGASALRVDGGDTRYVSAAVRYQLTSDWTVLGQASWGTTRSAGGSGLIGASQSTTNSWSFGLMQEDAWRMGDRMAFSVSQPMRVTSGTLTLWVPTVDVNGNSGFSTTPVSLAGGKTETDLEWGYAAPLSPLSSVRLNAVFKHNAYNETGNVGVIGLRYQEAF